MMCLPTVPHYAAAKAYCGDITGWSAHARAFYQSRIEGADDATVDALARKAVIDQGGVLLAPHETDQKSGPSEWGPGQHELSMLGCVGFGDTIVAAARDWAKAASRMADGVAASAA